MNMETKVYVFYKVPETIDEFKALPEAQLQSPFDCVALTLLALMQYEDHLDLAMDCLNFLKGPAPISPFEQQFLKDRLFKKQYKVRSFFEGSSPENQYEPLLPYTLSVMATEYSYPQENWATLYVKSSGADHLRSIKLRCKASTGQWFLNDIQCLSDIRLPQEIDPWA